MIPPGDGKTNATRTLTFELVQTDISDRDGPKSWYNVGNGEATVSVLESGTGTGGPGLSVGPADSFEQPGAVLAFEVILDSTSQSEVSVDYATRDGTATAGQDYTETSGTLTFAPGETVRTVEVPVRPDTRMEDLETVWLDLSNPLGAVIVRGSNYGQIHNITPVEPPRVQGGPRVSPPDPNGAWMEGKTVEVTVTFNEAVEVKTNGGTPDYRDQSGYIEEPSGALRPGHRHPRDGVRVHDRERRRQHEPHRGQPRARPRRGVLRAGRGGAANTVRQHA